MFKGPHYIYSASAKASGSENRSHTKECKKEEPTADMCFENIVNATKGNRVADADSPSSRHGVYQDFAASICKQEVPVTNSDCAVIIEKIQLAAAAKAAGDSLRARQAGHTSLSPSIPSRVATPRSCAFPLILHSILEEADVNNYDLIISWQYHGRAFQVYDSDGFVRDVMPHFFQQTRYNSFLRQLSLYGFKRIKCKKSPDEGCYYHEKFLRGMSHLAAKMQRSRGQTSKQAPVTEPEFTKMPTVGLKRKDIKSFPDHTTSSNPTELIPNKLSQTIRNISESSAVVPLIPQLQTRQIDASETIRFISLDGGQQLIAPTHGQQRSFEYHYVPFDMSTALPCSLPVQNSRSSIISDDLVTNTNEQAAHPILYYMQQYLMQEKMLNPLDQSSCQNENTSACNTLSSSVLHVLPKSTAACWFATCNNNNINSGLHTGLEIEPTRTLPFLTTSYSFAEGSNNNSNSSLHTGEEIESADIFLPLQYAYHEDQGEQAENADLAQFLSFVDLNNLPNNIENGEMNQFVS